jgi:two-component system cell cycle sensor histidine kinase/response regulator CckA
MAIHERTVLVIDDEKDIVRMTTAVLKQSGIPAVGTSDPVEAVQMVADDHSIKLILADLMMPTMNGPELVRRSLRQREDDVRVAFMSGSRNRLPYRSTDPFFQKPFSIEILTQQIRETLTSPVSDTDWNGPERRRHPGK